MMNVIKGSIWIVAFILGINLSFEKMWIEKWDGKLPVYGQVPTIFKDISK